MFGLTTYGDIFLGHLGYHPGDWSCQHKNMLQSKWQFRCHYTRQFSCNLQCMAFARQVANKIARVTPPPHNLSPNEKWCCELQELGTSPLLFRTLQVVLKPVTFFFHNLQCNASVNIALYIEGKVVSFKRISSALYF